MKMGDLRVNGIVPLYRQFYDTIRTQIDSGEYRPGDRIPSELELCARHKLSRVTVRSAIQRLVDDSILVKLHGKGTFVAMPVFIESVGARGSFTESCLMMNSAPSTRLISREIASPARDIAERLGVDASGQIILIKRLRLVDGLAVIFEADYFRMEYDFLMQENLENASLLNLLYRRTGAAPKNFDDLFDVVNADKEQALHLGCPHGRPLLRVLQTVRSAKAGVVYFNEQFIRSDRYKYAVFSH
jgi:GntR family transcriptional regulator